MKLGITLFFISMLVGCTVQFGIEYTGKTDKDNRSFSTPKTENSEKTGWW